MLVPELLSLVANRLRKFQSGIGIGNKQGLGPTANNFIGKQFAGGERFSQLRAQNLIHRDAVRMPDEVDLRQ